jgi:hypothetical protein
MKQIATLFSIVVLVVASSCGYKASDDTAGTPPQDVQVPAGFPTQSSDPGATQQATQSTTPVQATNGSNTTVNPIPVQSSAAGLNPAHGQPGHRCDIAVGAPLDSKPSTPTTTTTTANNAATPSSTPTIISTNANSPVQATPQKSAAGLNPAHGQPGHRCDIAVGAPLDSKPTSTQPTATTPVTSGPVPVNNPVQKTNISPIPVTPVVPAGSGTSTAGKNPAHGQPGHRCDIAVGAPLDSKPAAPASTAPKQ